MNTAQLGSLPKLSATAVITIAGSRIGLVDHSGLILAVRIILPDQAVSSWRQIAHDHYRCGVSRLVILNFLDALQI
jgi:hypothetical protein